MAEERRLTVTLVPKLDNQAMQELMRQLQDQIRVSVQVQTTANSERRDAASDGDEAQDTTDTAETTDQTRREGILSRVLGRFGLGGSGSQSKSSTPEEEDDTKGKGRREILTQVAAKGIQMGTQGLMKLSQASLSLVENIYGRLKAASPLLQGIESLFNLAVQLFFMPIGNKLGEVLIPAVLNMLDGVMGLWDKFEGMTLSEAIEFAMTTGLNVFADFFRDIGGTLKEQGGILGSIGEASVAIGDFVEKGLPELLTALLDVAMFIFDHLKEFISIYIGIKSAEVGATLLSSIPIFGSMLGGAVGFAVGGGYTYNKLSEWGLAEGGHVPATEGGQWRLLAEGGEGEYVIPDSKVEGFIKANSGGSVTITNQFYGYTSEELTEKVTTIINDQVSGSRVAGGF